jgi:UPF0271 protein
MMSLIDSGEQLPANGPNLSGARNMSTRTIDINADAGESFGRWTLGNDAELFKHVTTVNIACGYHAGDPGTMRRALVEAREAGVSAGAHPGYPDLLGFGRRAIPVSLSDTVDYVIYQVGALQGIAATEGVTLTHVKPHGSLYAAIANSAELAVRVAQALQTLQPNFPMLLSPGEASDAVLGHNLNLIQENAADLEFDSEGRNVIEAIPMPKDPELVADQAVRMAFGTVLCIAGQEIPMEVDSICIHGDRANAPQIAQVVRRRLEAAGVVVKSVFRG